MPINFPTSPTNGQVYYYGGKYFTWSGTAWRQANTTKERLVSEYTSLNVVPEASSVSFDPNKYNYFKMPVNSNTAISVLPALPYSKFALELDYGTSITPNAAPWDISTVRYDKKSYIPPHNVGLTSNWSITFKPDGTKLYILDGSSLKVFQHTLNPAWDLATATYDNVSFSSSQDSGPIGLAFRTDGTRMFIIGGSNDRVYQYNLSSAWNVGTATYASVSFLVSSQDNIPRGVDFKTDGTKMYVVGSQNDRVYQYALSTAWTVSSASFESKIANVAAQTTEPFEVRFSSDGARMFVAAPSIIYQYSLSTPWDVSTASYDNVSFSSSGAIGMAFSSNGALMYTTQTGIRPMYQYSLLEPLDITVTWAEQIKWANNSPVTTPSLPANVIFEVSTYEGTTWIPTKITESPA